MKIQTSRQFLSRLASRRTARALQAALLLTFISFSAARAATYTWDPAMNGSGTGGSGTWSTTVTDFYPGAGAADVAWPTGTGNIALFGGTAGTITIGSAISDGGMVFTTAGYTINSSAYTFTLGNSTGVDTSALTSGATTINQALTLGNNSTFTVGAGSTLNLGGLITVGTTLPTFTGTGATTTSAGTGQTNISGGMSITTGKATFNGIVNWTGGAGTFGTSGNAAYTGIGSGTAGTFNMTGGTITASFLNNFYIGAYGATGAMNISAGSFTQNSNSIVYIGDGYNGTAGNGNVTNAKGTLTLSGTGSFSTGTAGNNTIYLGNASAGGAGEIDLNTGGTLSTLDTITRGNAAGTSSTGNTAILNFNGGTLQALGNNLQVTGLTAANIRNSGAIIDTQTFAVTLAQPLVHSTISGDNATDGGLTKIGSGTLTLTGANTYNGGTTINAGTLYLGASGATFGTGGVVVNSGAFAGTNTTAALTVGNNISGAGGFIQNSTGITTLTGTNSYSGVTNINQGTLSVGTLGELGSTSLLNLGSAALTGIFQYTGAAATLSTPINLAGTTGGGTLDASGTGALTVSSTIQQTAAGNKTLSLTGTSAAANTVSSTLADNTGGFTGTLSVAKTGPAGTWVLSGSNTYSGATSIAAGGTLAGVGSNAFGNTSGITVVANAILSLRGDTSTTFKTATAGTNYSVLASSGAFINADDATAAGAGVAKTMTIGAITTGSTSATYALNFTGANNTSLSVGNITSAASTAAAADTIYNTISGGGSLTIAGFTSGNTAGGDTLNFSSTGNTIVTGAITPSSTGLALNKTQAGTLTLNGASTYAGGTTITTGNILATNSSSLGTGAVTVSGPGNTAASSGGTLQVSGGITLANPSISGAARNDPGIAPSTAQIENVSGNNTISSALAVSSGGGAGAIITSDSGTLTLSGTFYNTSGSGYSRPFFLTGAGNGVVSGNISNVTAIGGSTTSANNLTVTKEGTGTWTLTGTNTYTGGTNINAGTLDLGGSTATGSIGGGALTMGGGTLNYTRTGGTTQAFTGTTFNSGGSTINVAAGNTLALGAITRNTGGTVYLGTTGTITTSTNNGDGNTNTGNTNGFLGAYAVYGSYDWASNNGSKITYFTGYTTYNNVASVPANVDLTDNGNGYDGTYTGGVTSVNSIRFNEGNSDSTINLGGNLTVSSGGILVTPNLGQKYARINGSGLTTTATDLVVQQQNTSSGHLQIGSSIYGAIGLTKAGPGQLDINGTSASYTGATTVNGGTLFIQATTAVNGNYGLTGTSSVVLNNSGTVLLGGSNQINNAATVTLNGGTLNTGGYSQGAATGSAAATQGLGALTLTGGVSSTLDFGSGHSGSSVLAFADSHTANWSGTLTLLDFTPGTDELNFASSTGLTSTQLGDISLSGFTVSGLDSFGDVVFTAVPEPATWAAGVLMVGVAGWQFRRRTVRRAA